MVGKRGLGPKVGKAKMWPILHHNSNQKSQRSRCHDAPKDAQPSSSACLPLDFFFLPAVNFISHIFKSRFQSSCSLFAPLHTLLKGFDLLELRFKPIQLCGLFADILVHIRDFPLKVIEHRRS